jgi:hypothetical protein
LSLWYDAVSRIRVQLMVWMDKQSKHIAVSWWHDISFYTLHSLTFAFAQRMYALILFLNLLAIHHFGSSQACLFFVCQLIMRIM